MKWRCALHWDRDEAGLVRQLLAETLIAIARRCGTGLVLAKVALLSLVKMHPANLPQIESVGIDWRVLTFALSLSLITVLLFGLAPAITGTRLNLVDALKQGGRSATVANKRPTDAQPTCGDGNGAVLDSANQCGTLGSKHDSAAASKIGNQTGSLAQRSFLPSGRSISGPGRDHTLLRSFRK